MPKRLMTEEEYAAWQQNVRGGFKRVQTPAGDCGTLETYVRGLESTPDKPTGHSGRKQRRAKRQNGD